MNVWRRTAAVALLVSIQPAMLCADAFEPFGLRSLARTIGVGYGPGYHAPPCFPCRHHAAMPVASQAVNVGPQACEYGCIEVIIPGPANVARDVPTYSSPPAPPIPRMAPPPAPEPTEPAPQSNGLDTSPPGGARPSPSDRSPNPTDPDWEGLPQPEINEGNVPPVFPESLPGPGARRQLNYNRWW